MISASAGGQLTLPDQTVLKIPAGGLQQDTQVTISKTSSGNLPAAPPEMTAVGDTYAIDLGSATLAKPATLEIPFDPRLLPNGASPSQVFLSYFDKTTNQWVFAGGQVDTTRNVVILDIPHASWWRPTTWNWGAWIAVLNKVEQASIVNWIQAVQLLTASCPQTGNYVQVDSSQALNLIQGCVEQDDAQHPVLRIINPRSFYYEIAPISGGSSYPAAAVLAPGDDVKFTASTSDPSPLVVKAQLTQKAAWYLVIHMIITMLPGLNQLGIQSDQVACVTERLSDVSDFASAVESLLNNDGAAAAESISHFMHDSAAVQRFLTATDDCNFGPAPTWSVEGLNQIGGALSVIQSATDYIANYFVNNNGAQVSFNWTSLVTNTPENSICGVVDSHTSTGAWVGTLTISGSGQVIDLWSELDADSFGKLCTPGSTIGTPGNKLCTSGSQYCGYIRIYDPIYASPGVMKSFSKCEGVVSCP